MDDLVKLVDEKSREIPNVNQTVRAFSPMRSTQEGDHQGSLISGRRPSFFSYIDTFYAFIFGYWVPLIPHVMPVSAVKFVLLPNAGMSTSCTNLLHCPRLLSLSRLMTTRAPTDNCVLQLLREVDGLLTDVSDKIDEVKGQLAKIDGVLADVKFLDRSRLYGERIEFER